MTRYTPSELKTAIYGPVFPILTPFTPHDYGVDRQALQRYVDFLINAGAPVILVTVGTSRFNLLTPEEMMAVNQAVVRAVEGRAVAIAAGPPQGSLSHNIQFAQHAQAIGADAVIILYPERYYGDDDIYEFYRAIAQSTDIGVMVHEMPMRSGFYGNPVQYSLDLLHRLTDLPNLVGLKEECGNGDYAYTILRQVADKTAVIAAGGMRRFMRDYHAGAKAYLVGIGSFLPTLALQFYEATMAGDLTTAHAIVRHHEDPYFDLAVSWGWHRTLKETLAILGLLPGVERPPLTRLAESEQAKLKEIVLYCGWIKKEDEYLRRVR